MAYQFQSYAGGFTPGGGSGQLVNPTNLGLSTPYNTWLFSAWFMTPPAGTTTVCYTWGVATGLEIQLSLTELIVISSTMSIFWRPTVATNTWTNLIVSGNQTTKTVQAFINGQNLGGYRQLVFLNGPIQPATNWLSQPNNCMGDLYYAETASFFDLTVPSNLAKIISGSVPVDPGSNGQSITGSTPAVFLHLPPGAPAGNYTTNLGTGGNFNVQGVALKYGICGVYPTVATPVDLACGTASSSSITAQWQPDPSGAAPDSYTLQWATNAGGPFTTVTGILTTSYVVSGVAPGTTVFWRVAAVVGSTTSAYSALTTCSTGGATGAAITSGVAGRRWRGLVGINWLGFPLVGDAFSPVVGLSDFNAFEEFGQPMIMTVTTPPLQNDRKRIFVTRFEVDMQVGDGLPDLPEDGGTVLLSVSKDSGMTWGTLMKPRSMGAIGEYRTRLRWLNLGQSRAWVFKLVISDPVRRQIIGAYWTGYEGLG